MKNREFYQYLLKNNLAYFYANYMDQSNSSYKKQIIKAANILDKKFKKTSKLIFNISKNNNFNLIYFKTYKHIPEVVDNDIDLIISPEKLSSFIKELKREGFACVEETKNKYICNKAGFSKIEPRSEISIHGQKLFNYEDLKKYTKKMSIDGNTIVTTTQELDSYYFILNVLFGPNYLKLYQYLVVDGVEFKNIKLIADKNSFTNEINFFQSKVEDKVNKRYHFPLFLGNTEYLEFFFRFIFGNSNIKIIHKLRHFMFFFYMKYKYIMFNKLHFQKVWPINL